MNQEEPQGNGRAEEVEDPKPAMPSLPELFVEPFGMRVEKINTPDEGQIALIKILTPGLIYTIKLGEQQAKDLSTGLTGGIQLAGAHDLARLKG